MAKVLQCPSGRSQRHGRASLKFGSRLLVSIPQGYLAPASFVGEYAKRLSCSSNICSRVCPRAISIQQYFLASIPNGYLAPAQFAGKYARRLSCSSIVCWRVCQKAILHQHNFLSSMPKSYLVPSVFAGEYAYRLSRLSTVRSTIVDQNCVREVVSFPPKRMRIPKQCYQIRLIVPNPVALTRMSNSGFRLQKN